MKWAVFTSVVGVITLSGCSYLESVGNSFGQDEKNAAAELATKTAKVAAENSDSPEAAVTNLAVNEGASHIGASIASRLTSETSRTKVSVTSQQSQDTAFTISNVTALGEIDSDRVNFVQSSLLYKPRRSTLNLGLGTRQLNADETAMFGVNVFLDYAPKYGHQRASIGAEIRSSALELTANQYFRLSGWKTGEKSKQERAMNGTEIEIGAQVPYIPSAMLMAKSWEWSGKTTSKGKTYSVELREMIGPGITVNAGVKNYDGTNKDENFATINYAFQIGNAPTRDRARSLISNEAFSSESMRPHLLDEVKRTNEIVVETAFSTAAGGV